MIRYITSDCDAVSIIHDDQGYAKSPEDAVVDVLKAGMVGPFPIFLTCLYKVTCDYVLCSLDFGVYVGCLSVGSAYHYSFTHGF